VNLALQSLRDFSGRSVIILTYLKEIKIRKIMIIRYVSLLIMLLNFSCLALVRASEATIKRQFNIAYKWAMSKPLIEPFPYHIKYNILKPTIKEKRGIKFKLLKEKELNIQADYRIYEVIGAVTDIGANLNKNIKESKGHINYRIINDLNGNIDYNYKYSSKAASIGQTELKAAGMNFDSLNIQKTLEKKKFHSIFTINNGIYNIKKNEYFPDRLDISMKLKTGKRVTRTRMKNKYIYKSNPLLMKDIDTDKVVCIDDQLTLLVPKKNVKIGDQWEKQVYRDLSYDAELLVSLPDFPQAKPRTQTKKVIIYKIELYTYELFGFSRVNNRRCAIIQLVKEDYQMSELNGIKNPKDLKKIAKTLSKSSPSNIRKYVKSRNLHNDTLFSQKNTSAFQLSKKSMGYIAFDYQRGIVIESHIGTKGNFAMGVSTGMGSTVSRILFKSQKVFKVN